MSTCLTFEAQSSGHGFISFCSVPEPAPLAELLQVSECSDRGREGRREKGVGRERNRVGERVGEREMSWEGEKEKERVRGREDGRE